MLKNSLNGPSWGKKGNTFVLNAIFFMVFLLIFAILAIASNMVFSGVYDSASADFTNDVAKDNFDNLFNLQPDLLDNGFLFVFVCLTIFVLLGAFFIDEHPIFYIIAVILVVMFLTVAAILGNAFDDFAQDSEIGVYADNFTYTPFILTHLVESGIALSFMSIMVMFVKRAAV
jgi:hypothetical protein